LNEISKELRDAVLIGDDAEVFVKSPLGQKVIELARIEVDAAALDMRDADLKDERKLREIQNRIWRAMQFEQWLEELITRGREALEAHSGTQN
jgi:hypothetical protein